MQLLADAKSVCLMTHNYPTGIVIVKVSFLGGAFMAYQKKNKEEEQQLLSYQMPHSQEAEQAVLGAMLIDSRCVPEVMGLLQPEDFFLKQNRDIFKTIFLMFQYAETIDPVTVLEKLRSQSTNSEQIRDYLVQLMEITPTAAHAMHYANIIREKSVLRGLLQAAEDIAHCVRTQAGTATELLDRAERSIYGLKKWEKGDAMQHVAVVMHKVFDQLGVLAQSDSEFSGMSTGMHSLDMAINGLNNSDLLIVAARPGRIYLFYHHKCTKNVASARLSRVEWGRPYYSTFVRILQVSPPSTTQLSHPMGVAQLC